MKIQCFSLLDYFVCECSMIAIVERSMIWIHCTLIFKKKMFFCFCALFFFVISEFKIFDILFFSSTSLLFLLLLLLLHFSYYLLLITKFYFYFFLIFFLMSFNLSPENTRDKQGTMPFFLVFLFSFFFCFDFMLKIFGDSHVYKII